MSEAEAKQYLDLEIPEDLLYKLERLAAVEGCSPDQEVEAIMKRALECHERENGPL